MPEDLDVIIWKVMGGLFVVAVLMGLSGGGRNSEPVYGLGITSVELAYKRKREENVVIQDFARRLREDESFRLEQQRMRTGIENN